MKNDQEFCPQCPNHCHKASLHCERGSAYFGLEESAHSPKHKLDGVAGLLKGLGHILHHNPEINNEKLCASLTKDEQKQLETLLNKMLSNLK